jgi:hypothetical protein
MAAHVQAAIQAGRTPAVQPKAQVSPPVRPVAPHVQAAMAATAPPSVQPRARPLPARPLVPHVAAATAVANVAQRKPAPFIPPPPRVRPPVIQRARLTFKDFLKSKTDEEIIKLELVGLNDLSESSEEEPSDSGKMDYGAKGGNKKQARVFRVEQPKHFKSARNRYNKDPKTPFVIETSSGTPHMVKEGRGRGAFIVNPANRTKQRGEKNVGNDYPAIVRSLGLKTQQDEIDAANWLLRIMQGQDVSKEVKDPTKLYALNKLMTILKISETQRGKEATRISTFPALYNIATGNKPLGSFQKLFAAGEYNADSIFLGASTTKSKHGGGAKILEETSKGNLSYLDKDQKARVAGELRTYYKSRDLEPSRKRTLKEITNFHEEKLEDLYRPKRSRLNSPIPLSVTLPPPWTPPPKPMTLPPPHRPSGVASTVGSAGTASVPPYAKRRRRRRPRGPDARAGL